MTAIRKTRVFVWVLLVFLIGIGLVWYTVFAVNRPDASTPAPSSQGVELVREDSHRSTSPAAAQAQLVEFVDFACQACRQAQPLVEELKKEYGDRVTFVSRYFPQPADRNSAAAALAVEAAAQQGKYEQMYSKMFQTQPQWSGKQESQASLFRSYAQDLGLDMDAYDSAVTDDKTKVRVKEDITDGTGLGVKDAPTFFLNDKMLKLDSKEQFGRELAQFSAK